MNKELYTYLLAHPQNLSKEHASELDAVICNYPYFQSARALQLKGLKNDESYLYNDALKVTAAYTTDRDILFEYITSDKFIQNEISEVILQHDKLVEEIEVEAENISETVSLELDRQIKSELQKAEAILNPELFERKQKSVAKMVDPQEEVSEIDTNKPLTFTQQDTHSFGEWLKLAQAKPIQREEKSETEDENQSENSRERKFELIDKFIQDQPKLKPSQSESQLKNLAEPYAKASDALMTETLAKVYLQQKNYGKAIQAYKILILKNPEKSGFFADQIRAIKKLIKKET